MARILGVDPGTGHTGWCIYDTVAKRALDAGQIATPPTFRMRDFERAFGCVTGWDIAAVEKPVGMGPTRPSMVDVGIAFGCIVSFLGHAFELSRLDVCKALASALHGAHPVKGDAGVWDALVMLHGAGSDKRGRTKAGVVLEEPGAIGIATGHARAALAVAVAHFIRCGGAY